jgi:zinc transport system ATP-binding protein
LACAETTTIVPPDPAPQPAVRFDGVSVVRGDVSILDQVCATVPQAGFTAIIGPNGAGKTTLLLALLGETGYQGAIRFPETGGRRPRIGYVPQRFAFDRNLPLTVAEFLALGFQRSPLWFGIQRGLRARLNEALAQVAAEDLAPRPLGALSGGELQRVLLALALMQQPELLVLDEPAAGVDFQGELLFCELLERLRRLHRFTLLMVSHDLGTVTHHATHVICLNRRTVAEGPPSQTLTSANLMALFGLHMGVPQFPDPNSCLLCRHDASAQPQCK